MEDIKDFKWTDELALQFASMFDVIDSKAGIRKLAEFKRLKEKDIPKDWEILSFKSVLFNHTYILVEENKYASSDNPYHVCDLIGFLKGVYSVQSGDIAIHSVKRLTDNFIITIGDDTNYGIVQNFILATNEILVDLSKGYCMKLRFIEPKPKVPLFTTEDGVEIFEGEWFWWIKHTCKDFYIHYGYISFKQPHEHPFRNCTYFSSKEKAEQFRLLNKPIEVSYKEIKEVFDAYNPDEWLRNFFAKKVTP